MVSFLRLGYRGFAARIKGTMHIYSWMIMQVGIQITKLLNKSLKPTVMRVTLFAEIAKPAPRYGGFYISKNLLFKVY